MCKTGYLIGIICSSKMTAVFAFSFEKHYHWAINNFDIYAGHVQKIADFEWNFYKKSRHLNLKSI